MTPLIVFAPDGEASLPAPKPYRKHSDTLSVSSHRSIPQSRLMTIDSGRITGYPEVIEPQILNVLVCSLLAVGMKFFYFFGRDSGGIIPATR